MHVPAATFPYEICNMNATGQLVGVEQGEVGQTVPLKLSGTTPIKNYYIDYYNNKMDIETDTPSGDADFTTNCFGYVFGISTWVQDPQYLYEDNATPQGYPVAGGAGRQGTTTHGYKVIAVWPAGGSGGQIFPTLKRTKDKFRESQIFQEDFAFPGRTANAAQFLLND